MRTRRKPAPPAVSWQLLAWGIGILGSIFGMWYDLRERVKVLEVAHELSISAVSDRIEEVEKQMDRYHKK